MYTMPHHRVSDYSPNTILTVTTSGKRGKEKKKKTRAKERGTRTAPNNKGIQAIMIQHPTMDKLVMGIIRVL